MQSYSNSTWGYKILSDTKFSFFHMLLPKLNLQTLRRNLPSALKIVKNQDGSIIVQTHSKNQTTFAIQDIIIYLKRAEDNFIYTPNYTYHIEPQIKNILKNWSLAFLGCIGLILTKEYLSPIFAAENFEFINSDIGGLYINPYTLLLYGTYPKIIHPITSRNYPLRDAAEKKTSLIIKTIVNRIKEAQRGYEGLAMLSIVHEKTSMSTQRITKIMAQRSFGIKTPIRMPIFSNIYED